MRVFHIVSNEKSRPVGLPLNAGGRHLVSALGCQTLSLGRHLVNVADHVEGDLGQMIVLAGKDCLEARDGLIDGDKFARVVSEDLSDLKEILRFEYVDSDIVSVITWKGWERNLSIFLALATFSLSSSDNSSIPRIAMMSCRDL